MKVNYENNYIVGGHFMMSIGKLSAHFIVIS